MHSNHPTQNPEPLTDEDLQIVEQLLALSPTSSQLVAALHETFVRETRLDASPTKLATDPIPNARAEGVLHGDELGDLSPTLCERAREIDPRTSRCCSAFWGEWVSPTQRQVQQANCWYPVSDQFDFVPHWAMREAWPELAPDWEDLLQNAWKRHLESRSLEKQPALGGRRHVDGSIYDDDFPL